MNLETTVPLCFYINLARREDRRRRCRAELTKHGITAERFPAVPKWRVTNSRGLGNVNRYATGLSKRLVIREADRRRAPAVAIFEDDVVFHAQFRSKISLIELPEDWAIFYLGCAHRQEPIPLSQGLVKVVQAFDNHAVIVRQSAYLRVLAALKPKGKSAYPGSVISSDEALAELSQIIPCYAAFPNLAWQRPGNSDNQFGWVKAYHEHGAQIVPWERSSLIQPD